MHRLITHLAIWYTHGGGAMGGQAAQSVLANDVRFPVHDPMFATGSGTPQRATQRLISGAMPQSASFWQLVELYLS